MQNTLSSPSIPAIACDLIFHSKGVQSNVNDEAVTMYAGIQEACSRIVDMDDRNISVHAYFKEYVINGRMFKLATDTGDFLFWVGINGHRLFYICRVKGIDVRRARKDFRFCFGGAQKVGWDVNYEPVSSAQGVDGVSIWATCSTDRNLSFCSNQQKGSSITTSTLSLTPEGLFWATDIAMMAQSWIRTCQRFNIACHDKVPAPL